MTLIRPLLLSVQEALRSALHLCLSRPMQTRQQSNTCSPTQVSYFYVAGLILCADLMSEHVDAGCCSQWKNLNPEKIQTVFNGIFGSLFSNTLKVKFLMQNYF